MKIRRYGKWAGDPEGVAEDKTRCVESVYHIFRDFISSQCSRKRGHGPDGLYCKQHAMEIARREYLDLQD